MSDVAAKFNAPVISGNVSFYNEMEGVVINPSPATGVVGVGKLDNIRTLPFKNESDKIIILGKTYDEVDGSEYHRSVHGVEQGIPPKIRLDEEYSSAQNVLKLIENDESYVDCHCPKCASQADLDARLTCPRFQKMKESVITICSFQSLMQDT